MAQRIFGHVGQYRPGDLFGSRAEMSLTRIHAPLRSGVSGTQAEGVDSIVLADQYEDDLFTEEQIWYAGHGGRDAKSGKQVADQVLTSRNAAFLRSQQTGQPVRVLRKILDEVQGSVYRYEGLYTVVDSRYEQGKSGFMVWKFLLRPLNS
ncbi:SAD/SRA domain-containing protein [Hymenobacter daecheongensis DSM 21074]|uniref:SAD/SRA domain-containing protein n=1 Tax=Hymenobacter daecheongensis DSM 21074 TaxID=1121955 RepID=A0A1M6CNP2_9BACT|nr:YDG/SRA domain-containing protein [Hymenobacter daecheongensis]SHI62471.1 SAD/SRA domain-containing protein [Hymenobacter daecheongensis DSM 21074]